MFEPWAIPLAALIIAVAGIIFTVVSLRRTASTAYINQLERRIELLEKQLVKAMDENAALRSENYDLLQRLFHATGGRRALPEG